MMKKNAIVRVVAVAIAVFAVSTSAMAAAIYEPFDDSDSTLAGNTPGAGLSGVWSTAGSGAATVNGGSLTYGALPTSGNTANLAGASNAVIVPDSTLADANLLDDGATLWFSFLYRANSGTGTNNQQAFALGTDVIPPNAFGMGMSNGGNGVGVSMDRGSRIHVAYWSGGGRTTFSNAGAASVGTTNLLVVKAEWGATGTDPETLTFYRPATDLLLPAPSEVLVTPAMNQALFDTISFSHRSGSSDDYDEIRFGASYEEVIGVMAADIPEPATASLAFAAMAGLITRRRRGA